MAEPLTYDDGLVSGGGPLPIDKPSPIKGMTYRELAVELDDLAQTNMTVEISSWEVGFIGDAMDNPHRFKTPKQLSTIVSLWEKYCG